MVAQVAQPRPCNRTSGEWPVHSSDRFTIAGLAPTGGTNDRSDPAPAKGETASPTSATRIAILPPGPTPRDFTLVMRLRGPAIRLTKY